jgi:hypothetical protein
MDNVSSVWPGSGDSGGDSGGGASDISDAGESSPPGWEWPAPRRAARAPSCAPSASPGGFSGGRFWVLCEVEDDDGKEEEAVASEVSDGGERDSGESSADSPRPSLSRVTLGDFISRAEELGGSLSSRRRAAFAPGGKGSRFLARSAPRFSQSGDSDRSFRDRGACRRSSSPAAGRGWASSAPALAAPVPTAEMLGGKGTLPRPSSLEGLRAGPPDAGPALGWALLDEVHLLLLLGPPSGFSQMGLPWFPRPRVQPPGRLLERPDTGVLR